MQQTDLSLSARNGPGVILLCPTIQLIRCYAQIIRYRLIAFISYPVLDLISEQRHMEKLPRTQAITRSFPWGRLESDGSFNFDIARGHFEVLGASGNGYWSHHGDLVVRSAATPGFDHLDGEDLLGNNHLSDKEGWKLPSKLIPHRAFLSPATRPKMVTEFKQGIRDWDSWYLWRKLEKESPAALLMNYPMSVYQIVVECLELTSANAGKPGQRVALHLHLLGIKSELNYLPLCVYSYSSLPDFLMNLYEPLQIFRIGAPSALP